MVLVLGRGLICYKRMAEIIDVCQTIAHWLFMLVYQWVILQPSFLHAKRPFHWISMKRRLVRAARETSTFPKSIRRRYMAEILPIRRKTLHNQSFNQSIHQSIHQSINQSINSFSLLIIFLLCGGLLICK